MPIKHTYQSTIPDNPEAVAAGEVTPSRWNEDHTNPDIADVTGLQDALDEKQATLISATNIKTVNGNSLLGGGDISISGTAAWGSVTGTLSAQTDLQTALNSKVDKNSAITGATKTKITYDAKGLVTAGADATTADIADSTNRRYVTDAQLTVIGNTSGTNTGDQDLSGYATTSAVAAGYQPLATVLTNTTASFTTAQETKLAGIAAGAEVNVNADWNAVSGDAQILNKPTIPDLSDVVLKSDYTPAHSILVQQSGTGSPTALQISNNTLVGRLSGGGSDINDLSATDVRTLLNVADGATANSSDATLLNRANHTGVQAISTITALSATLAGLQSDVDNALPYSGAVNPVDFNTQPVVLGQATMPSDENTLPTTPANNNVSVFGKTMGGREMLAFKDASGLHAALQPHIARSKIALVSPINNTATFTIVGTAANTAIGTVVAEAISLANNYSRFNRVAFRAASAAVTSIGGFRAPSLRFCNQIGYHFVIQWGVGEGVTSNANGRAFAGMRGDNAAITDVNPSTLINIIGMGWDATDINIQMLYNDGSGTASKIDLGGLFPKPSVNATNMYELCLFARPNGDVDYEVRELLTSNFSNGTISTDKPAQTQLMAPFGYVSAGGAVSVRSSFALAQQYVETPY